MARTPEYFTARRIRQTGSSHHRQKYRNPVYTMTRQANIRATGSRGFASEPLVVLGRWVGGRLKAVTLSVI
jgi:hypothetical protein